MFITEHSNRPSILLKIKVFQYLLLNFFFILKFLSSVLLPSESYIYLSNLFLLVCSLFGTLLHHELCPLQTTILLLSMSPSFQCNHAQVSLSYCPFIHPVVEAPNPGNIMIPLFGWKAYLIHQQVLLYPPQKYIQNLVSSLSPSHQYLLRE